MKEIQKILINFLNDEGNNENSVIQYFNDISEKQNLQQFKELLHLLLNIANNYHRKPCFYKIYEEIFRLFKDDIKKNFTNNQILRMFVSNKLILLILFKEKILVPDEYVFSVFQSDYSKKHYLQFFYPEIKDFLDDKKVEDFNSRFFQYESELILNIENIEKDFELFEINRKNGENDKYICKLIKDDAVEEFISYVNQANYHLSSEIQPSIFETNSFLLETKNTNLLEYCAFHGSIQIFKYLIMNNVKPTPSLWLYSIHGQNADLIHFLEEEEIKPEDSTFIKCLIEAIKCHHNNFAYYIQTNLLNIPKNSDFDFLSICMKHFNFHFFPDELEINSNIFYDFCKFDYLSIVESLLNCGFKDSMCKRACQKPIDKYRKNETQLSPFQVAVKKGNLEIVKLLLDKNKIDVNERSLKNNNSVSNQNTPLAAAVINRDIDMVKLLLAQPDINVNLQSFCVNSFSTQDKEKEEMTPLHFAIKNNDAKMVEFLINQANINVNNEKIVKIVGEPDQIKSKQTPLSLAVEANYPKIVQILVSKNEIDINMPSYINYGYYYAYFEGTSFHEAALSENLDIIRLLLTRDDIDANSFFKYKKCKDDVINEKTALFLAIENENKDLISILLSNENVDVNLVNVLKFKDDGGSYEKSPLYKAVEIGDSDIVKLLLTRKEININYKSIYNSNRKELSWNEYREKALLHLAVETESIDILKMLLEQASLDVNETFLIRRKTSKGAVKQEEKTALHLAIQKDSLDAVRLLLTRNDIQINMKYHFFEKAIWFFFTKKIEKTALHMAAEMNNVEIARLLLSNKKIDVSIVNELGKKPIDITQNNEIGQLLILKVLNAL